MGEGGFCELSSSVATCMWTHSNHILKIIPEDAPFDPIRDSLARVGGRLLVSVLRDMLAGKVHHVESRFIPIPDPPRQNPHPKIYPFLRPHHQHRG